MDLEKIEDLAQYSSLEGELCKAIINESTDNNLVDTVELILDNDLPTIGAVVEHLSDEHWNNILEFGLNIADEYNIPVCEIEDIISLATSILVSRIVYQ